MDQNEIQLVRFSNAMIGACDGVECESFAVVHARPGVADKIKEIQSRVESRRIARKSGRIDGDE
jgi:hypothetical protein